MPLVSSCLASILTRCTARSAICRMWKGWPSSAASTSPGTGPFGVRNCGSIGPSSEFTPITICSDESARTVPADLAQLGTTTQYDRTRCFKIEMIFSVASTFPPGVMDEKIYLRTGYARKYFGQVVRIGVADFLIKLREIDHQRALRDLFDVGYKELAKVTIFFLHPVFG